VGTLITGCLPSLPADFAKRFDTGYHCRDRGTQVTTFTSTKTMRAMLFTPTTGPGVWEIGPGDSDASMHLTGGSCLSMFYCSDVTGTSCAQVTNFSYVATEGTIEIVDHDDGGVEATVHDLVLVGYGDYEGELDPVEQATWDWPRVYAVD